MEFKNYGKIENENLLYIRHTYEAVTLRALQKPFFTSEHPLFHAILYVYLQLRYIGDIISIYVHTYFILNDKIINTNRMHTHHRPR